ncbi:hypothetical protein Rhe02_98810 [Rhizocola hellebori]|uniref:Uncharacterized protein n=1 Tax=Rhizocola hellebori TaxID=1392758 RepID=A0A8J3VLZ0_9ACTN|nr:hypothetical protein Rhe02_98810 [Rhizocola hellebori]
MNFGLNACEARLPLSALQGQCLPISGAHRVVHAVVSKKERSPDAAAAPLVLLRCVVAR